MKFTSIYSIIFICVISYFFTSCKHSDNSMYYYNESNDTIAPVIKTSVPLADDVFYYGDDIHIVGNVTDLETVKISGKLKTFSILVTRVNGTHDTDFNVVLNKTPNVDGKDGYTFNEKMNVAFGSETTYYKLLISAYDYAGRSDIKTSFFKIQ